MLHPMIRWLARRGIRWFYRDVSIVNADNIPATGATLLVASHGNDLTDILLAFIVSKRDVLFVANVAAADSLLVRWTYAGLGVIPVARTRDARALLSRGENVSALNERAFTTVTSALEDGNIVAIFPEGIVNDLPHLAPLRTGAARMALDAIANGTRKLQLIPVGFQYERPRESRSDVVAVVGDATCVNDWRPVRGDRAVSEFTRFIRTQLLAVTRNSVNWSSAERLNQMAAATGAVLSSDTLSPLAASHTVQRTLTHLTRAELFDADPPHEATSTLNHYQAAAMALTSIVTGCGGKSWSAVDHANVLFAAGDANVSHNDGSLLGIYITAPIAAIGWLWHCIPFWGAIKLAASTNPLPEESAGRVIVPGLYVVATWYVTIPLLLLILGAEWWFVLVLFIVQPRLGDFSFEWRDRYRTRRLMARVRQASTKDKSALMQAAEDLRRSWREVALISIPKS